MLKKLIAFIFSYLLVMSIASADEAQNHLSKGNELAKAKKYDEAVIEYDEVLKADPKNVTAALLLGLTYANLGKLDQAIQYTSKASKWNPSYTPFYNLGLIHAANNEPDKAIRSFDQALTFNPKSFMAEYQKGLVYASQQAYSKAAESYQRAIELNPQFNEAHLALAGVSYKQGDKAAALAQVEELRKLKKDNLAKALDEWINEKRF